MAAKKQPEAASTKPCQMAVEKRKLSQWFLKITDFADELLDGLSELKDWPDKVRLMQENWIGRSRGLRFKFALSDGGEVEVFTTRPDTIFGSSFVAVAAVGFLVAVGRRYGPAPLGWLLRGIVEVIRGTPFLIQVLTQVSCPTSARWRAVWVGPGGVVA